MLIRCIGLLIVVVIVSNLFIIDIAEAANPNQQDLRSNYDHYIGDLTRDFVSTTSPTVDRNGWLPVNSKKEKNQSVEAFRPELGNKKAKAPPKPAKSERYTKDKRRPKKDDKGKSKTKKVTQKRENRNNANVAGAKKGKQKSDKTRSEPDATSKAKHGGGDRGAKAERKAHRGERGNGAKPDNQADRRGKERVAKPTHKQGSRKKKLTKKGKQKPASKVTGQKKISKGRAHNVRDSKGGVCKSKRESRATPLAGRTRPGVESAHCGAFDIISNNRGPPPREEVTARPSSVGGGIPNNSRSPEKTGGIKKDGVQPDSPQTESEIGPRQPLDYWKNSSGPRNHSTAANLVGSKTGKIPYYEPSGTPDDPVSTGGQVVATVGSVWIARRCVSGPAHPDVVFFTIRTSADVVSHYFWRGIQVTHQWRLDEKLVIGGAPFSRFDDSDPLAHDLRSELYDKIKTEPGTHLSSLTEETGSTLSTVRHHLRVLEREKLIRSRKIAGKRRLVPSNIENSPEQLAALADESTVQILRFLRINGSADVTTIAERLNLAPSTISHHLSRLETTALVERERDGQSVTNQLTQVAETLVKSVDGNVGSRDENEIL